MAKEEQKTAPSEFITPEEYNQLEKPIQRKFVSYSPNSQINGFFRVRFLGKITHPATQWESYLPTENYFTYQMRCVKNFGLDAVSFLVGADWSLFGVFILILGFILGILIRLPIAIILTIIQLFVVVIKNKKTENNNRNRKL